MSTPTNHNTTPAEYTHCIPSTGGLYQYIPNMGGFLVIEQSEENLQCGENMDNPTEPIESTEPKTRICSNKYSHQRKHSWGECKTPISDY